MPKFITQVLILITALSLFSCKPEPTPSTSSFYILPGDIVVSNITNDSVVVYSSDGVFKRVIYDLENNAEVPYGVGWKHDTLEVMVAVDGSDRVMGISAIDGSVRTIIQSASLSGSIRGVTQLVDGSILVAESNGIEKFTTNGVRVTDGFPLNGGINNVENVFAKADGGFVVCARGGDVTRTYEADGTMENSTASGIGGTTDGYGCTELDDGTIASAWSGSTDTISFYDSGLTTLGYSYNDTSLLPSPRGVAQLANGNIVVADATYHHLVEIDAGSGDFVGILASSGLSTPNQIVVIPDYL
ncbi:hypothetical protein BIY24_11335 [Halobacteriovorax marinus]|uniref:hypothetical protein n=1 Tax=Halobacteriovorax marinus TaxID=97084 RepID=UPI000BC3602E|nr:hypothetical protein [Halobacteriovorax marinus]ATH08520.1 hypothetical protein BIY24_11335 [Halobacteriovorax marinus]